MLYVFVGPERISKKGLDDLLSKHAVNDRPMTIEPKDYSSGRVEGYAVGESLFGDTSAYILDECMDDHEASILEQAPMMTVSENVFIIQEKKLLKVPTVSLEKAGAKIIKSVAQEEKKKDFSSWGIADAILLRDKKKAWTLYIESLGKGTAPEDAFYAILWTIKMFAWYQRDPKTSAIKPFHAQKFSRATKVFSLKESQSLFFSLLQMLYESRHNNRPFEYALEEWILKI